ncbi:M23/M56 family metallopeptidase [Saccharicrinis aurantiacus]|uniref:M23/M56 family metallopeptidase n=1 Tax=Saccharicrinis aurantiacus TaxID=1849719 RepID=UPI00094FC045|nr:M23/M56 family metallopeptidase [Saccharicrinis aurantiacus]
MEPLAIYIFKSTLASGVFFGIYYLCFKKESFFKLNRFYLLFCLCFAYVFPFIKLTIVSSKESPAYIIHNFQSAINQFAFTDEAVTINTTASDYSSVFQYWWLILLLMISGVFIFRFIKHIIQLNNYICAYDKINYSTFTLVLFDRAITFSFFRYIFISPNVLRSPESKSIIAHELSHIKHKHSFDRLFVEVLLIIFWMNPFIYFYRKALEEVHEFQADEDACINSHSVSDYFKLVLQQSAQQSYSPLMSPFSYKLIKKRIKMTTYKSNPLKKLLVVAPIAIAVFIVMLSATLKQEIVIHEDLAKLDWPSDNRSENVLISDNTSFTESDNWTLMVEKLAAKENSVLPIYINIKGTLLINGQKSDVSQVRTQVESFYKNNESETIIFLKKDQNTPNAIASAVISEVATSIEHMRNIEAKARFSKPYYECNDTQKQKVQQAIPMQIVVAPSKNMQSSAIKKQSIGAPIRKENLVRISSGFGQRIHPITKRKKMHNGVDYVAPLNTPVLCSAEGTVRFVKQDYEIGKGHGRFIIVDHANGYSSLYSQLNSYAVKEGQKIKKGSTVGYVGSSGVSTGPHLHFELKKDGQYIDPKSVIE